MDTRVSVAKTSDIEPGTGKIVEVNRRPIALFSIDGTFHAIVFEFDVDANGNTHAKTGEWK